MAAVAVGATSFSLTQDALAPQDEGVRRAVAKQRAVIPFRLPIGQRLARDDFAPSATRGFSS